MMDAIVAARVARSGWPKTLVIAASNKAAQVQVLPAHFNASAWVLFGLYGIAHFALLLPDLAIMEVFNWYDESRLTYDATGRLSFCTTSSLAKSETPRAGWTTLGLGTTRASHFSKSARRGPAELPNT